MQRNKLWFVALATLCAASARAQNTFPVPSGNVGIGTTSPATQLDVSGGGRFLAKPTTSTVPAYGLGLEIGYYSDLGFGQVLAYDRTVGALKPIQISGSTVGLTGQGGTRLFVQGDGNVGIGTTTPAYSLDVSGQIHSSSGFVFSDGSTQTTAYTAGNSGYLHLSGNTNPTTTEQGTYLGWNALTGGIGETDFINNQGGGSGGFAFMSVPPSGSPKTTLMFISGTGNVGIGTAAPGAKLEVNGNVLLTAGSGASMTYPDGTVQSTAWNGVLTGGDYAESVNISGGREEYEPGDVLVIDATSEGNFLKSSAPYSTAVTGIYSTKPGVVGRRQRTARTHMDEEVPMAMTGIVPTKVSAENGPIKPGDLLVTSSKPGYAMKGTDRTQMLGAVIGKAIGHLDSGVGVIEAVVALQ